MFAADARCDLTRLERTNMVTKMEDRIKIDLVALSGQILDQVQLCDPEALSNTPEMLSRIATQFNQGALLQYQRQLAGATFFRLERACAYWELGLSAESRQSACEYLAHSDELYRVLPFVDSLRSRESVKQSLNARLGGARIRNTRAWENNPSIDFTFEALMEFAPRSTCLARA
jgi:hypothetical protein